MYTQVKTGSEIKAMRASGQMLASVLQFVKKHVEAGLSTKDLAELAKKELRSLGGKPAFLGYQGFPDVLCTSVNEEIVHGIPSTQKILRDGDILSMDFGVIYDGMTTDSAISVIVGNDPAPKVSELLSYTERSLMAGIDVVKDGVRVGDISSAVQAVLDKRGYGIIRDLVGHGVGHELHEEPNIPNYGSKGTGPVLSAGMTIAIEPMASLGTHEVRAEADGWTVATLDNSLSAHFEHTVLITENGADIITAAK